MSGPAPSLQVIEGGKAEDARATLRDMYTQYGAAVESRCAFLLKDAARAEDAMQDVFAQALTHLAQFRREASPLTWLMKIATHHCLNLLRGDRPRWLGVLTRDQESEPQSYSGPQLLERRDAVRRALHRVDVETQAAAIHYHVDEMTLEEVAALLGRSVPTIRKRLEHFAEVSGRELRQ